MGTSLPKPRRLTESRRTLEQLQEHVPQMSEILSRRMDRSVPTEVQPGRRLKECVAVLVWEEEDGSESLSIARDGDITDLGVKGMLHDAIYALVQDR